MLHNIQSALADVQYLCQGSRVDKQYDHPIFKRSVSILIVDANQDQAELLATLLNIYGHDVVSALTGEAAIAMSRLRNFEVIYICNSSTQIAPFELVEKLKTLRHLSESYFVAMSGHAEPSYRVSALNSGFKYFIVKPAEIGDLCAPVIDKSRKHFR